jgi:hypothetical protein
MDKYVNWVLSLVSVAIVALVTATIHNMMQISERPTLEQIKKIVRDESPYVMDRSLIRREFGAMKEMREEGASMRREILKRIEANTGKLTALTIKIERMAVVVEQQKKMLETQFWKERETGLIVPNDSNKRKP